jgi:hypothetical protein
LRHNPIWLTQSAATGPLSLEGPIPVRRQSRPLPPSRPTTMKRSPQVCFQQRPATSWPRTDTRPSALQLDPIPPKSQVSARRLCGHRRDACRPGPPGPPRGRTRAAFLRGPRAARNPPLGPRGAALDRHNAVWCRPPQTRVDQYAPSGRTIWTEAGCGLPFQDKQTLPRQAINRGCGVRGNQSRWAGPPTPVTDRDAGPGPGCERGG